MRSPYQIPNRRRAKSGGSRRRVLELLASPDGCTEPLLLANGFSADLLIELVRAGLVSAQVEGMMAALPPTGAKVIANNPWRCIDVC